MNVNKKKLAIGLVTYNDTSSKYLPSFLLSLYGQSFFDFDIFVADNSDKEENANKSYIKENYPDIEFKWMKENAGFATAYNFLIEKAIAGGYEYFMVVNCDTQLENDTILKLINALDADLSLGSVCPKILSWDFENSLKTDKIDSCGIIMIKPLRFVDLGQGEKDEGQYDGKEILGPSGAAGIFRLNALNSIKDENGYFDDRMLMYKEDCDLAYRLSLAGFGSRCVHDAIIYHDRTAKSIGTSAWSILANRHNKSMNVRKWSFINQQMIFYKHRDKLSFKDKISVSIYQIKIKTYVFFFEHYLFNELKELKKFGN